METLDQVIDQERRRSVRALDRLLPLLEERGPDGAGPEDVVHHWEHSNDLLEVRIGGRRLMVKRGVEAWASERFESARAAARLLRDAGIEAPAHLDVPPQIEGWPVLVWWRIPRPTLQEVWPGLDAGERRRALRSWGALLRRIHGIRLSGWGPLPDALEDGPPAAAFLDGDLSGRLRPAVAGEWPEGLPLLDALRDRISTLPSDAGASLLHNDPHFSNVLCETGGGGPRCVGVLDLEASMGGTPEADLAYLSIVHSPFMAGSLGPAWLEVVVEGYGRAPDPYVLSFFRVYHLLNLGFHAAHTGWSGHAEQIAAAAREGLREL